MTKDKKIQELEKRIEELEKRPQFFPYYPPIQYQPLSAPHYHGTQPCWQNPCVWG